MKIEPGCEYIRWIRGVSLIISLGTLSACVPREAYEGPVKDLGVATENLNKVSTLDLVDRNTRARLIRMSGTLSSNIKAFWFEAHPSSGNSVPAQAIPDDRIELLCSPRKSAAQIASFRDYLAGTAAALNKIVQPPPKETAELAIALLSKYDINVNYSTSDEAVYKDCADDFDNYLETIYNESGRAEFDPGAAISALEVLANIINEASKAILTEIDSSRRAEAMRHFLSNDDNKKMLDTSISKISAQLTASAEYKRHTALNEYNNAYDALSIAIKSADFRNTCKSYISLPNESFNWKNQTDKHAVRNEFRSCFKAKFNEFDKLFEKVLSTAANYDVEANRTLDPAINDLKKAVLKLEKLADDDLDKEEARAILVAAIRIGKVLDDIQKTATSEDTHKKVSDAISKLRDAL